MATRREGQSYWYGIMRHTASGERYAVMTEAIWDAERRNPTGDRVVGICGPLHYTELPARPEDLLNYDYQAEDADWAAAEMAAGRLVAAGPQIDWVG